MAAVESELASPQRASRLPRFTGLPLQRTMDRLLIFVGLIVLWVGLTRTEVLPSEFVPSPVQLIPALGDLLGSGSFWGTVASTFYIWAAGLAIATFIGIPAGLMIGSNNVLRDATSVTIEFLRPVPSVALIPMVILVFGSGYQGATFLVAFACLWPQLVQSTYGARAVDRVAWETASSYRLGPVRRFIRVTLPSASPYILTGCRVASSVALIIVITSGIVIGSPGLGEEIAYQASAGAYAPMYALVLATGVLGYVLTTLIGLGERRLLRWQPEFRAAS